MKLTFSDRAYMASHSKMNSMNKDKHNHYFTVKK